MLLVDSFEKISVAYKDGTVDGLLPQSVLALAPDIKKAISEAVASIGLIPRLLPAIQAYEAGDVGQEQTEFCLAYFVRYAVCVDSEFWKKFKPLLDWHKANGAENPKESVLRDVEQLMILELHLSDFTFESFQKDGKQWFRSVL